ARRTRLPRAPNISGVVESAGEDQIVRRGTDARNLRMADTDVVDPPALGNHSGIGAKAEAQLDALPRIGRQVDLLLRPCQVGAGEGAAAGWKSAGIFAARQARRVAAKRRECHPGRAAIGRCLYNPTIPTRFD